MQILREYRIFHMMFLLDRYCLLIKQFEKNSYVKNSGIEMLLKNAFVCVCVRVCICVCVERAEILAYFQSSRK